MTSKLDPQPAPTGFSPEPLSSRTLVRCYRNYRDAKHAYDVLSVVARIPDKRMTMVARGLEWHEPFSVEAVYKLSCGLAALIGAFVGLLLWAIAPADQRGDWFAQTVLAGLAGLIAGFVIATLVARLRGRRVGTGHVMPRQYDILVEEQLAPAARQVLADE